MITVELAKQLLFARVDKTAITEIMTTEAFGYILAEDIFSPVDLPLFNQSVMDGYAVRIILSRVKDQRQFNLVGEIKAGEDAALNLEEGQAVRIFTGASVPAEVDAVVIQEKVKQDNGCIYVSEDVSKGDFIRLKGSQIKKGELALKKLSFLNPASIGFLASIGISKVNVYAKPGVSILVTGDEIVMPEDMLKAGQVYESNSFSLNAALRQMQIKPKLILTSKDEKDALRKQVEKCLQDSDIVLITGGISVGKYDFVNDVLKELEVETIFYKVSQKPGKPFLAGKRGNKLIFALPGNPASVLVCFYEYVYTTIRMMEGFENAAMPSLKLKLLKEINKKEERAFFIRAKRMNDSVMPLDRQDSSMLRSFAEADALIYIPMQMKKISKGEDAEVHLLPFGNY